MAKKQIEFDQTIFLKDLEESLNLLPKAEELGQALADQQIKQIYLVGCGAPNYMFRVVSYWANRFPDGIEIKSLYPSELLQIQNNLSEKTAIIFGSHSGTTAESVNAANVMQSYPCSSIAITQTTQSPLARAVKQVLAYGSTKQGYFSSYILVQALISSILDGATNNWKLHKILMESLHNLPKALANAKVKSITNGVKHANTLMDRESLFVVGNGPMYTTAFVFSACFLMEMQRLNAHPINALDFFHGPFEIMDKSTPLILLIGEDDNRIDSERIQHFCNQYLGEYITYDSKDFSMPGIHPDIRPLVAPFIVDAALTNLVEQIAILRNHPLDTRRYMGKVDY